MNDYNKYRATMSMPPFAPPAKFKKPRTLNMSEEGWTGLRALAQELGYSSYVGGNITAFLEAIGHRLWIIAPKIIEEDK